MKILTSILLIFICSQLGFSAERYFTFEITNISELDHLTDIISIDDVRNSTVWAYANDQQWEAFLAEGYKFQPLTHPGKLFEHAMANDLSETRDWNSYPTYDTYLSMMQQYATQYPAICKLDTFGVSNQGRLLLNLVISDNVNTEEAEPEFFYTSTMHGDETVGYVLLLRLADFLLSNYGNLTTADGLRATNLIDNMEIWVNPLFNPDGTYAGGNHTVTGATRSNATGTDLNRNFPDRSESNTPNGREIETQAMMALAGRQNFILSANFHGGAQVVNYPWENGQPSGTYSASPDDAWYIDASKTYATPNPDILYGGFPSGITNGCAWYATVGSRQDWMYFFEGSREVTVELWDTKNPPGSVLPQRWTNNKESLLAFMEKSLQGVRGIVTDSESGLPIKANISVLGREEVPVYTDTQLGDYYRLVKPGTYSLIYNADHYTPDTLHNIVVTDSPMVSLNVALQPLAKGYVYGRAFLADTTDQSNIEVRIEDQVTYTNASGYFSLPDVFSGPITVEFSKPSYATSKIQTLLPALDTLFVESTLYPTEGMVLVINDDNGERVFRSAAESKSSGIELNLKNRGASCQLIQASLEAEGYSVIVETPSATDPQTWLNYDMLIWSCGANTNTIASASWQSALQTFVSAGGNLVIEGGEIGYDHRNNSAFASNVLQISGWSSDNSGNLVINNITHPITNGLPATINLNYGSYGDQDAVTPVTGAQLLIRNANYPGTGGVILNGNVIFISFNLASAEQVAMNQLIRNSAQFLQPVSRPQKDLAVLNFTSVNSGDLFAADTGLQLQAVIKNYGEQTVSESIPLNLQIANGIHSVQFSGNHSRSIAPGDTAIINFGSWIVPDTLCDWQITAELNFTDDEVPSNNLKSVRFSSLASGVTFTENFESINTDWIITGPDTNANETWQRANWPVSGGFFSNRILPDAAPGQDSWLISPQISSPQILAFYWDYGSEIISGNTLQVLLSTQGAGLSDFSDTLLTLADGNSYPENGFLKMQVINLSQYAGQTVRIAFRYSGSNGNYWAIDNVIAVTTPMNLETNTALIPSDFSLRQNYPNPFNPTTTIEFALPQNADIEIAVFNILGAKVFTLANGNYAAGIHSEQMNGNHLSSGVYFYRITAYDPVTQNRLLYQQTRKFMILK